MKTIRITKDITDYYNAEKGNATYVLEKGVSITSSEFAGFFAVTDVENRDILIKGDINGTTGYGLHVGSNEKSGGGVLDIAKSGHVYGFAAGVHLAADDQVFNNDGKINGATGVQASGDHLRLDNDGYISGTSTGVDVFFGTGVLRNDGMISGGTQGVSTLLGAGDNLKIINNGTIGNGDYAMVLSNLDGARTVIVNHGEINGKYWSIQGNYTDAVDIIRNRGTITNQVGLGDGNDVYDGRGGSAKSVDGGKGDDTYYTDDPLVYLYEQSNSGTDTIKSSITWKLNANLENLILTGKNSITGTGSDDANHITGNQGQNVLSGMGGIDILNGGKGMDELHGGTAGDHFVFVTGTNHDVIADFQDGVDLIDITGIKGITTFEQIAEHMVQNGTDVDISLGGKDMITIDNITIDKLTAADFAY